MNRTRWLVAVVILALTTVAGAFASPRGTPEVDPAHGKLSFGLRSNSMTSCQSDDGVALTTYRMVWKGEVGDGDSRIHDYNLTGAARLTGQITVNTKTGDGWGAFKLAVNGSRGVTYDGVANVVTRFASPDTEVRGFVDAAIKVNNVATGYHFVANFEMLMRSATRTMVGVFGNPAGAFASTDGAVETTEQTC